MNCPKCNAEIKDGSKFCMFCGAKMEADDIAAIPSTDPSQQNAQPLQVVTSTMEQALHLSKPLSKQMLMGIVGGIFAIIILIVLFATQKTKIDLQNYTKVTFTGYDTYGTASIVFDSESLWDDLQEKAKGLNKTSKSKDDVSALFTGVSNFLGSYDLIAAVDWELDKKDKLSNGDTVVVSYTFDNDVAKKYGIKFVGQDKTFTVSGLEDIQVVDPFADIVVTFSGTAPKAWGSIENNSIDGTLQMLKYTMTPDDGLSNGDTVTVEVEWYGGTMQEFEKRYGYKMATTSKEYTCEGLGMYLTDASQLPDATLEEMKTKTTDKIEAYIAQNSEYISMSGLVFEGYYFLSKKENASNQNKIYIVYSTVVSSNSNRFDDTIVYFPLCFSNLILQADGTIDLSGTADTYLSGRTSLSFNWFYYVSGYVSFEELKNALVTAQKDSYDATAFGTLQ